MEDEEGGNLGSSRRFSVALFIVHPTLKPDEITAAVGLEANNAFKVGDARTTPAGSALSGVYRETRWRHDRQFETYSQHFSGYLSAFVDELMERSTCIQQIIATGGSGQLILAFLDADYYGDTMPRETLAKLVELELAFGIECFAVP